MNTVGAKRRMQRCPVCFGELEVREVNPCFVCGGWPAVPPSKPEHHFLLRDTRARITLCHFCWLEEVLSDQGDLKARLKIKSELDLVDTADAPTQEIDKFCTTCNRRFALLKAMAGALTEQELECWRS